jgi:hypothetical protein
VSDDGSVDQKGANPAVDLPYSDGEVASYLQNALKFLAAEVSAAFIYLSSKAI